MRKNKMKPEALKIGDTIRSNCTIRSNNWRKKRRSNDGEKDSRKKWI